MPAILTLAYLTCGLRVDDAGSMFCSREWRLSKWVWHFWVFDFFDLFNIFNVFFFMSGEYNTDYCFVQNFIFGKIQIEKYLILFSSKKTATSTCRKYLQRWFKRYFFHQWGVFVFFSCCIFTFYINVFIRQQWLWKMKHFSQILHLRKTKYKTNRHMLQLLHSSHSWNVSLKTCF